METTVLPDPPGILYLSSEESTAYFPENTGGNFTTYLPFPLALDASQYEVGLLELFYKPKKQEQRVFKQTEDGLIKTRQRGKVEWDFSTAKDDTHSSLNDWLLDVHIKLLEAGDTVQITEQLDGNVSKFSITNKNKNLFVVISSNLAEILGFDRTELPYGAFNAMRAADEDKFTELPINTLLEFKVLNDWLPQDYNVPEPSSYDMSGLIQSINSTLNSIQLSLTSNETIRITSSTFPLVLEFGNRLSKILNIPPLIYLDSGTFENSVKVKWPIPKKMLCIGTDLIVPCSYGSSTVNWLRIINQSEDYDNTQHIVFNPVIYHSINRNFTQSINSWLCDEKSNQYDFGSEPVIIALSIRRKEWKPLTN